ncbi:integrator complex subunit 6-A-like isoform X1 [Strongylocentrotus purpuratus]|uniref:VWFA domain-containing protein n=1 Tax=Strongylocentrotus purpuratus TaxID=7668 RepID=A0A7M7NJY7_STRPU|nr:integrator complex subunit 6-A-like isoform X1 [Strongylocentrotus purpuratus]
MPVLVFLIDTSASMNQRTHLGTSLLDIAKGAVETFMKLRLRDQASRTDRYMLVTCDESPATIKAGWKENPAVFMSELKNLQATGLTTLGHALKMTFDLLNVNRLYSGIDNYGQGRNPFYLEPAIVIAITDGHKLSSNGGVQEELSLPMSHVLPGSELTREPFRWDQRLFALVLRLPGVAGEKERMGPTSSLVNTDDSPISSMCDVTGGRSYMVNSMKTLNQCLESLVQKVQSGVVVHFEKFGPDPVIPNGEMKAGGRQSPQPPEVGDREGTPQPPLDAQVNLVVPPNGRNGAPSPTPTDTSWYSCRRMIHVRPNPKSGVPMGHWPIPETFWPDPQAPSMPQRVSHPVVKFTCTNSEPMILDQLPFDKYELEPSPLTQYILERRNPNSCWQVFVPNSSKNGDPMGYPFGFLKASSNLSCVNLIVMPYNYPTLIPLLDDLCKVHKLKPSQKWKQAFDAYLEEVPRYYAGPLKVALRRMGAPNLIPDGLENCLSYSVVTYLKKLKQHSKVEGEKLSSLVASRPRAQELGIKVQSRSPLRSLAARRDFQQLLQSITGETITVRADNNVNEFPGYMLRVSDRDIRPQTYRNPFDIPRKEILDQVVRMRANFLQITSNRSVRFMNEDKFHNIPIAEMGNYQEYLKRIPSPLREADPAPARLHTFGNPFKLATEKDKKMMVDEADINDHMAGIPQKRRASDSNLSIKKLRGASPPSRRPTSPGAQGALLKLPLLQLVQRRAQNATPNGGNLENKNSGSSTPERLPSPDGKPPDLSVSSSDESGGSSDELVIIMDGINDEVAMETSSNASSEDEAMPPSSSSSSPLPVSSSGSTTTNHVDSKKSNNTTNKHRKMNNNNVLPTSEQSSTAASTNNVRNAYQRTDSMNSDIDVNAVNSRLRAMVIREVRKPGKNFRRLFEILNQVQGDVDTKYLFIESIINEAKRFRRKALIGMLETFRSSMVTFEKKQTLGNTGSNHVR